MIFQTPHQTLEQTRHQPSNRMQHALITKTAFKVNWYMNTSVQATHEHEHELAPPHKPNNEPTKNKTKRLRPTNQSRTKSLESNQHSSQNPRHKIFLSFSSTIATNQPIKNKVSRKQPAQQPEPTPQNFSIFFVNDCDQPTNKEQSLSTATSTAARNHATKFFYLFRQLPSSSIQTLFTPPTNSQER